MSYVTAQNSSPTCSPDGVTVEVDAWIIIALLVGIVGAGFAVTRLRRSRGNSSFDLGEVSQSWLTEQRASKQSDRWSAGNSARPVRPNEDARRYAVLA